jgi:hypothetical protein
MSVVVLTRHRHKLLNLIHLENREKYVDNLNVTLRACEDRTKWKLCPLAGFHIRGDEPSGSVTTGRYNNLRTEVVPASVTSSLSNVSQEMGNGVMYVGADICGVYSSLKSTYRMGSILLTARFEPYSFVSDGQIMSNGEYIGVYFPLFGGTTRHLPLDTDKRRC